MTSRSELCTYPVERALNGDQTILVTSPERTLVLKRLSSDCLLNNQLHPDIRDRLSRIRELATTRIAQVVGVERDADAWLVWHYVEGTPLAELDQPRREALQQSVRLAIAALHSLGIVHGAIHGRNIIIADDGTPRLTHASPLLYNDPATDWAAFDKLFPTGNSIEPLSTKAAMRDPVRRRAWIGFAVVLVFAAASAAVVYRMARPATVPTLTP